MNCKLLIALVLIIVTPYLTPAQPNLNAGLMACYPFSGNANDQTSNAHDGIVYGPVLTADRFNLASSAYLFDGIDDYIDLGLYSAFTQMNEFSLSVWIKPDLVKTQTIMMLQPDNFYDRLNCMAYYSHNGVPYTFWDYGDCTLGGRLYQANTVFSNSWQHYVYTVHPVNGMNVYKNGVLEVNQATSSSLIDRQRNLWIGGGIDVAGAPFYFQGIIDDMRLYDREISAAEAQLLYGLELMCQPVGIAENQPTPNPCQITVENGKIVVDVQSDSENPVLRLFNAEGKLVCPETQLLSGQRYELPASPSDGLIFYSIKTVLHQFSGKILNLNF